MKEKIKQALILSMKNKNVEIRDSLRFINSEIARKEKDTKQNVTDDDIIGIIKKEIAILNETEKTLKDAGRDDGLDIIAIKRNALRDLLPTQLSEEEVIAKIDALFTENNYTNMGQAMKDILPKIGSIADKKLISALVKDKFNK